MGERDEKKPGIAEMGEQRPAQHGEEHAPSPPNSRELCKTSARQEREKRDSSRHEAMQHNAPAENPMEMPCRAATNPMAQNKAAPAPQARPAAILARDEAATPAMASESNHDSRHLAHERYLRVIKCLG